jgi:phage FluMu protein Com
MKNAPNSTEKDIPPEATIMLEGIYYLSDDAHELAERTQKISITVNACEAIRTGYAWINHAGMIAQLGDPRALFFKLEPAFGSPKALFCKTPSVTRRWEFDPREFDRILTEKEATDFVVNEMSRFDAVLAEAKNMSQRDMIGEGEVCRWCHKKLPEKTGKPSDCPRCAETHKATEGVIGGSEECLKCEAGITYGPARLPTCFMCAHALKANHFSDRTKVRCPHCKRIIEAGILWGAPFPGTHSADCPECGTIFNFTAVLVYESPTIFEKTELQAK